MLRFTLCAMVLLGGLPLSAQEKSVRPDINKPFQDPDLKAYIGKFELESREIFAHRKQLVEACGLKPGMAVADIGAGTGLFTRLFAAEVGPKGKVLAVEISPRFLEHITKTSKEAGLNNVQTILCNQTSTSLPPNSVDVAFICDTYHHFEFPFKTMASLRQALKPGGRVILIDFKRIPGVSSEWTLNHVRAGQEQVIQELRDSGFSVKRELPLLKDNYVLELAKADSDKSTISPKPGSVQAYPYRNVKGTSLSLQVHTPKNWKPGDKRAAIVFFFGGGWTNGKVTQFEPQAEYLASRGMVAIRADYRVKSRQDVTPVDCVEDAQAAMRWVRAHSGALGIDPNRIVASGGSAGGHLAACTPLPAPRDVEENADVSAAPNALVLFNPVLKFEGVPELMKRLDKQPTFGKAISPTFHLKRGSVPAILFYGKEDRLLAQGDEYLATAKELGIRAEMFLADGVGHGFFNRSPWRERTTQRMDEFLQSLGYLSGPPTIRVP